MKNLKIVIGAFLTCLCASCCAFSLTACDDKAESGEKTVEDYYQIVYSQAQGLGYLGTIDDFIGYLKGKDGADGVGVSSFEIVDGELIVKLTNGNESNLGKIVGTDGNDGNDGNDGKNGLSAYEIYKKYHPDYEGTEEEWINSLVASNDAQTVDYTEGLAYHKVKLDDGSYAYNVRGVGMAADDEIIIPSVYNGLPVIGIEDYAFQNSKISSIIIPQGIVSIGAYAFQSCINLTDLIIPDSVTSIGRFAFNNCGFKNVKLSNSLKVIEDDTFYSCQKLRNVTIPDSVTTISSHAFGECTNLISLTIGNGVKSIASEAFEGCYKLIEVYNLSNLDIQVISTANGYASFYAYDIYTSKDEPSKLHLVDDYLFYVDEKDEDDASDYISLIGYYGNKTNIILPEKYNDKEYVIDRGAFSSCNELESITIPDSIRSIGSYAFANCSGLKSLVIPNSVTWIGYRAFSNCTNLTSITMSENVTSIGNEAFYGCNNILDVSTPSSAISNIPTTNLKTVTITSGDVIPTNAFMDCTSLESVTIQNGVTEIDSYAFKNCSSLKNVTISSTVTSIGSSAFYYCTSLANVIIGDNVKTIFTYAFQGCSSLTNITIPDSVTSIGDYSFAGCSNLVNVTMSNKLETIGKSAFAGCEKIINIAIPDSVTSIGDEAFYNCDSLENIAVSINNETYKSIDGNLYSKDGTSLIQYAIGKKASSFTVPDSVTIIANHAFKGCNNLVNVIMHDNVTTIKDGVFGNCINLTSVTFGSELTSIGAYAFEGCINLISITIPDKVTAIGYYTFEGCSKLTSITVGKGVTIIGDFAFSNCGELKTVYYVGTAEGWKDISIYNANGNLTNATRYYYSEEEPTEEGNWWHYVDGVPAIWNVNN